MPMHDENENWVKADAFGFAKREEAAWKEEADNNELQTCLLAATN